MFFGFDDEQLAFQAAVRDLLDKQCPPDAVRAAWEAPPGDLDRTVWDHLAEMGVLATLVPEASGGLGLDERSLVLVLEETGRAALPHPVVDTVAVAAPLLARPSRHTGGEGRQQDGEPDPDDAGGRRGAGNPSAGSDVPGMGDVANPAGRPPVDIAGGGMVATDLGGPNVPCAADADALLLRRGAGLYLVEPAAVSLQPLTTVDGARRAARAERAERTAEGATRAADAAGQAGPVGWPSGDPARATGDRGRHARAGWHASDGTLVTDDPGEIELAFDRGAFGTAAQLLGLGQRMLDLTVAYVKERQQFGGPVGRFQAVKHHLADALKEVAFARPAVHRAAHSLAVGAETGARSRDVSLAKAMASDAARLVGRTALQCHGAIGYTVEADLHLYLKRTWALAAAWGDAAWHRDRIGRVLGV